MKVDSPIEGPVAVEGQRSGGELKDDLDGMTSRSLEEVGDDDIAATTNPDGAAVNDAAAFEAAVAVMTGDGPRVR